MIPGIWIPACAGMTNEMRKFFTVSLFANPAFYPSFPAWQKNKTAWQSFLHHLAFVAIT
jgi:hypothetical protein